MQKRKRSILPFALTASKLRAHGHFFSDFTPFSALKTHCTGVKLFPRFADEEGHEPLRYADLFVRLIRLMSRGVACVR